MRCPRATAAAGRDLVEVKASAKMQLVEKGRKRSSKQPSACDNRSVKNKALVAEVLDHVNLPSRSRRPSACDKRSVKSKLLAAEVLDQAKLPSWSRKPSACDKRSGQRKEPVNEDLAQGKVPAAGPWTRRRRGRRSGR